MAKDILQEIVNRRIEDIRNLGWDFGFNIPEKRQRKIHAFMQEKGSILEVKRASPSKGDIAPTLDSYETAYSYAMAGAKAISCLTEANYFKGTLEDLMKVCKAVDDFEEKTGKTGPAVLRKDFLTDEKDIEIAYKAGADAVLLISRILDTDKMTSMALKCQKLGLTALVELRLDEDIEKLSKVVTKVNKKTIVCGVNSRDLKDFTIDLLTPCSMLNKIKKLMGEDAKVIFESGIRSTSSAAFAGSLGFSGMLLGEAAAKNPNIRKDLVDSFTNSTVNPNAERWLEISEKTKKPLIKICGITNTQDALLASNYGADFLGFIFCGFSKRKTNKETVLEIVKELNKLERKPYLVAVITELNSKESDEAIELVKEGIIDFIQLHGEKVSLDFINNPELKKLAHYPVINLSSQEDLTKIDQIFDYGEPRILVDSRTEDLIGGTGKQIAADLINLSAKKTKLWLAGGINSENVLEVINTFKPDLIDVASGLEKTPGIKDIEKMKIFFEKLA